MNLTRKAIKRALSCLLSGEISYPIESDLIWKFRQVDRPLPCKLHPDQGIKWLNEKIPIELTSNEIEIIINHAKEDSMAFDLLEELNNGY